MKRRCTEAVTLCTKSTGEITWTKRDKTMGQFIDKKALTKNEFKGVLLRR